MKCKEIIYLLEKIAPLKYAEKWDNVGLLIGDEENVVRRIMVALDPTTSVIEQAMEQRCDLLITHHPLIFSPMKRITAKHFIGKRVLTMMDHSIGYYAMHTNMDIAVMADEAAKMISIVDSIPLEPIYTDDTSVGIGRCGKLNKPMSILDLVTLVKKQFSLEDVRVVGDLNRIVETVAISTGSGEDYINKALECKADVIITGDIRHHSAIDALEKNICVIDAGHFGTERFMVEWLVTYLKERLMKEDIEIVAAKENTPFHTI